MLSNSSGPMIQCTSMAANDPTGESVSSDELRVHDIVQPGTGGNKGNKEFADSVNSSAARGDWHRQRRRLACVQTPLIGLSRFVAFVS